MNYTEIRQYAERNNSESHLTPEELDHVASCMEHIQKWYYEDYPLGDFLTAVVNNNLMEAVFQADEVNIKALKLYAWFLTWNLPSNWRSKAKGTLKSSPPEAIKRSSRA